MRSNLRLGTSSLLLTLVLTGCGAGRQDVSSNATSTSTESGEAAKPGASASPIATTPSTNPTADKPVDFTYLGVTPDKEHIRYKIKVNTSKQITQVDLSVKYMDGGGKVLDETTLLWQNIVRSKHQPIEKGKSYDVDDDLPERATKADVVLKRVVFVDGTSWKPN